MPLRHTDKRAVPRVGRAHNESREIHTRIFARWLDLMLEGFTRDEQLTCSVHWEKVSLLSDILMFLMSQ